MTSQFISGAIMASSIVVALYFFRFWKETNDRLFSMFSLAFALMALERIPLSFVDPAHESRSYIFLIRLFAFVLILVAIWDKNRAQRPSRFKVVSDREVHA